MLRSDLIDRQLRIFPSPSARQPAARSGQRKVTDMAVRFNQDQQQEDA